MDRLKAFSDRKMKLVGSLYILILLGLCIRVAFLMIFEASHYAQLAEEVEQRERHIKAARGRIIDRNGVVLASNKTVCTISVIHNQITEEQEVIACLSKELELPEQDIAKKVKKKSSIEKIKSNVSKEVGEKIRAYKLEGVKVDDDYKRYYPYDSLQSKVLGFTGGDNQGIIGLESYYDKTLQGLDGKILTYTDAKGLELEKLGEMRQEPIAGKDLQVSLDYNICEYATQLAYQTMEKHQAKAVELIVMNPQNGEIYAMVNAPEFSLRDPFASSEDKKMEELNEVWRNACISDTYEPGSIFKVITTAAALEDDKIKLEENFNCSGSITVEGTRIRCHKTTGHGSEDFTHAIMNSCNPVFIQLGLRVGVPRFFHYFDQFQMLDKTGVDLPGEAKTIMHRQDKVGPVELATISFGQSFQVTPIQLLTTVSSLVNGGKRIVPHVAVAIKDRTTGEEDQVPIKDRGRVCSKKTSETMQYLLHMVVSEGTGKNGKVEGYDVGGKTATSQMLPRGSGKYIASFVGFAPADDPQVIALVIIHEPVGIYYGGTIAAPVVSNLYQNILPYME